MNARAEIAHSGECSTSVLVRAEPIVGGSSLSSPSGFGVGREGRLCGREACRVVSFHPVLMLR